MIEIKQTLVYCFSAIRKKPTLMLIYITMMFFTVAQKMIEILLLKIIIDQLSSIVEDSGKTDIITATYYCMILVGSVLLTNFICGLCMHKKNYYKEWFDRETDLDLSRKTMEIPYESFEDADKLDSIIKAKQGMAWYSGGVIGVIDSVYDVISNGIVFLGISYILFSLCPLVLVVQVASIAVVSIVDKTIANEKVKHFKNLARYNRASEYILFEVNDLKYGKDIRLYDASKVITEKSKNQFDHITYSWRDLGKKQGRLSAIKSIIDALRNTMIYLIIGIRTIRGIITIGDFSAIAISANSLYQSISQITKGIQEVIKKSQYAYQYVKYVKFDTEEQKEGLSINGKKHQIVFEHVYYMYPNADNYSLQDINIKIDPNVQMAIVGPNGAGKTTFVKLLCRLCRPTEGTIKLDGVDIYDYNLDEYRRIISAVFQDYQLYSFSIMDNIVLDLEKKAYFEKVVRDSGVYNFLIKYPDMENTIIGKNFENGGVELSGGQRQKVALCRALYRKAPILLLDEPTSSIDPFSEAEFFESLKNIGDSDTKLFITHRMASCLFCDKVVVFDKGKIVETGTHKELMDISEGVYRRLFLEQAKIYSNS